MYVGKNERRMVEESLINLTGHDFEQKLRLITNDVCTVRIRWSLTKAMICVRVGSSRQSEFRDFAEVNQHKEIRCLNFKENSDILILSELVGTLTELGFKNIK